MFISIDIGGTDIKYGIINEQLLLVDHQSIPTAKQDLKHTIVEQIDSIVRHYVMNYNETFLGIGISTAGVVDEATGEIVYAGPTMPSYVGANVKQYVEQQYGLPTSVLNDVNAAALGEKWLGAAQSLQHFICITIGTGVGGAIFIDGKLYRGKHYRAGEIGHIPFFKTKQQSYEQVASMSALLNRAQQQYQFNGNGKQLFEMAQAGDEAINKLLHQWIRDVAEGLLPLLCTLDPEAIIIGGAVSSQGDYLINMMRQQLKEVLTPSLVMPEIYAAKLGNAAALYGAVYPLYQKQTCNYEQGEMSV